MAIRRDQLNHQQNQPTTAQQNMARYLDLEQKRRAKTPSKTRARTWEDKKIKISELSLTLQI